LVSCHGRPKSSPVFFSEYASNRLENALFQSSSEFKDRWRDRLSQKFQILIGIPQTGRGFSDGQGLSGKLLSILF